MTDLPVDLTWAHQQQQQAADVLSRMLPEVTARLDEAAPARTPEEQAARAEARRALVEEALVWLRNDSSQAENRVQQIQAAITAIDQQIGQVQGFTFSGTLANVTSQLNTGLKPQIVAILAKQKQVAQQLQELNEARDRHGDALVWLGQYAVGPAAG